MSIEIISRASRYADQIAVIDPSGEYIRKYVPELKNLPIKFLFSPWECPNEILTNLNFKLGQDYPHPIVDLKESRQRALSTYEK